MLNVGNILKSLSQNDCLGQNQALTSLNNFLSYQCQDNELFAADLMQTFFQDCMQYPHWQQNKQYLSTEVYKLIEATCRQQNEAFDLQQLQWPDEMQIIDVGSLKDWKDSIHSYLTFQHRGGEKFRIIHDDLLQKMIAIILKPSGDIVIRMFGSQFFIRDGTLTPLREDLCLMYNSELELAEKVPHKIETGPYMTTRFYLDGTDLYGHIVRGYFFQNLQDFEGEHYSIHAKLFYCLKRLESHFITKETNPFYQDLIADLEHYVEMIKLGDANFIKNAPDMVARVQNSLDYVFPNDKLISLLLKDLQMTLATRFESQKQTAVKQTEKDKSIWNNRAETANLSFVENPTNSEELVELTKKPAIPQTLL